MPIDATPTTLTATYDKWAMAYLHITGDGLADFGRSEVGSIGIASALSKYRVRGDGVPERSPVPSDTVPFAEPDLMGLTADPDLAPLVGQAVTAIMALLVTYATKKGVI